MPIVPAWSSMLPESPYSDLCLSVGLRMSWGRIVILDSKLGVKVFEFLVVELLSIIRYQCFWDLEPADYGPPNEVAYLLLDDCCQWLGL